MDFALHHIGIVVTEIDLARKFYGKLGFNVEGAVVYDPFQRVKIQFMQDSAGSVRIELLEPCGDDSPVAEALRRGGGLNHFCYQVDNVDDAIGSLRGNGTAVISPIVPAPAIGNRRVVFLYNRAYGVFELVETPRDRST